MTATTANPPAAAIGVRGFLDRGIAASRAAGREDLREILTAERELLDREEFTVLVIGEFGRGKSALVNALLGAPVTGVSARLPTMVPTFVRYGQRPRAVLITSKESAAPDDRERTAEESHRTRLEVAVEDAVQLSMTDHHPVAGRYAALDVELPRELLKDGLVLVDTSGVGGGFAAVAAARTVRTLTFADALVFVTDASAELTAPEVEFLQQATSVCPVALCVVAKTDLYPQWRRIVELDRSHLATAGLLMPVVAVSSVLRELAIDTGDPSLAAESGFPVLVRALSETLRATQRSARSRAAATAGAAVVDQLLAQALAEHQALTDPAGREARAQALREDEQRAARLHSGLAHWQEVLSDELRALRRTVRTDLVDRVRGLRTRSLERISVGDPLAAWEEFQPWLYREVNLELTEHHRKVMDLLRGCADAVAAEFGEEAADLSINLPISLDLDLSAAEVSTLRTQRGSWLDVTLAAARGFSLSSSVVGIVLFAASAPVALVSLPLTALLGSVFAARSVHATRQAQLRTVRSEVERAIGSHLEETSQSTARLDEELIDGAYIQMRKHFAELADRLRRSTTAIRQAAQNAAETEESAVAARDAELRARQRDLANLRTAAARALSTSDSLVSAGARP